jgi:hypothetical protein
MPPAARAAHPESFEVDTFIAREYFAFVDLPMSAA